MLEIIAQAQSAAPPAGGAALDQVILATSAAMLLTALLGYLGWAHRNGRGKLLARLAARAEWATGMPGWVALPSLLASLSLITALVGFLWDVSIHIDLGRDDGPLANPSHYLILGGLFGIFTAGYLACVLPLKRPSASAVRITGGWYAPLGGILVVSAGAFALTGFPLDDVWHRLFGQDVTLWGPTHLMLIGGAAMTLIGLATLLVEGQRSVASDPLAAVSSEREWIQWLRRVALGGGLLIGLCVFPVEFDFGVPQFRFVFGPILIMLAAGIGLVAIRVWLGAGSALAAALFFLVIRGLVSVLVGPVLGQTMPAFHLFLGSALAVEAAFLLLPRVRPTTLALASGLGIGTVGLASEWAWSNLVMPIPWTGDLMLPEGIVLGVASAFAGSLIGIWIGERLASDRLPRLSGTRVAAVVGALAIFAIIGYALYKPGVEGVSAQVTLAEARSAPDREVIPTVRFDPPDAADGAEFLNVTAWQGGGRVLEPLVATDDPGAYTTEGPIPVHGTWKSLIRMSRGDTLSAVPLYLPEDPAIPAEGVPAPRAFERTFVADHTILQREQKDAAPWLTAFAYAVVAAIALSLLALMAWGLHRLAICSGGPLPEPKPGGRAAPARRPGDVATGLGTH